MVKYLADMCYCCIEFCDSRIREIHPSRWFGDGIEFEEAKGWCGSRCHFDGFCAMVS